VAEGPLGTLQTLKLMRTIIRQYKANPAVIQLARSLVANLPPKNYSAEVGAVFQLVRDQIRYTLDPNGVEQLQTPDVTLQYGTGDCDDKVILLASLLESLGHPTRSIAIKQQGDTDEYSHVYVETKIGAYWYPLESTEDVAAGWAPPSIQRMTVFN